MKPHYVIYTVRCSNKIKDKILKVYSLLLISYFYDLIIGEIIRIDSTWEVTRVESSWGNILD